LEDVENEYRIIVLARSWCDFRQHLTLKLFTILSGKCS